MGQQNLWTYDLINDWNIFNASSFGVKILIQFWIWEVNLLFSVLIIFFYLWKQNMLEVFKSQYLWKEWKRVAMAQVISKFQKKNFKTDENNKQQLFLLSFYPVRCQIDLTIDRLELKTKVFISYLYWKIFRKKWMKNYVIIVEWSFFVAPSLLSQIFRYLLDC